MLSHMTSITTTEYRKIGQGFCGTVWAEEEPTDPLAIAIKREDGGPGRSLRNDHDIHQTIVTGLPAIEFLHVPACLQFLASDDQIWWAQELSRFPEGFQPCNALVTERIPPFSEEVRNRIVEKYCPEKLRPKLGSIKSHKANKDCLIRPYLGRRRRQERRTQLMSFSLRNFPLHLDQIEDLALNGKIYARIMAVTLARLYWQLHIDANDIEFVLAPPRPKQSAARNTVINSQFLGDHVVWILDFDCCKHMAMDEGGVEQAVAAFYRNDPFYPRPGQNSVLWKEFKDGFLEASEVVLGAGAHLPSLWISIVEQRATNSL
ncbi:MAG: hypothetical protein Q9170_004166 [Blastenia crenularia]